jgi:hypothetical protein
LAEPAGFGYHTEENEVTTRGVREKALKAALVPNPTQTLTRQQLLLRLTWAALIKMVYEVDPLKCPDCGGTMKIVALIDRDRQADVVEKILRHCGLWREPKQRAPPDTPVAEPQPRELTYDPGLSLSFPNGW